ncbi:FAD-dependent oxidoreductase [Aestuariibacter halophilus]|uniref:FAD-dependent oxidoreductase n=1 Tax=Fluctibacter halophilus TaxID=226011 RepID=A0ABS8G4G4_9ALTE|nr:FAD-dependent oxidoreductase [Aestuariibacter halophilus]MCC2614745.1 FAD-dependent oxidoreductase [Aestuariibacter halophilus]
MTQRIAIIGTGIAGMTCGYLLHRDNDITVFEANDYIGGHTATKDIDIDGHTYAIDTGFIVYNDWTYPNFIRLMNKLGVEGQPTEMSFSVKNTAQNIEYNGNNLNSLFAQRRNLLRPRFWRLVRDILRFNGLCKDTLAQSTFEPSQTLGDFLTEHRFSDVFKDNYILPMCAAIWSTSLADIERFPLRFFLQFFNNHGLLNVSDRPQWHTLIGGSRAYIAPLTDGFRERIHLSTPVQQVTRHGHQWQVQSSLGLQTFDHVIFACHSDQALAMLSQPSAEQQAILGNLRYADNDVVLHTDTRLLPARPLAWASWNYLLTGDEEEAHAPACVTYNMNILQRLSAPHTFCVTLNSSQDIDPDKVLGRYRYAHPQFNHEALAAQQRRDEICGVDNLHFCGAYWYNGFHEDGVNSALDVCKRFGASL